MHMAVKYKKNYHLDISNGLRFMMKWKLLKLCKSNPYDGMQCQGDVYGGIFVSKESTAFLKFNLFNPLTYLAVFLVYIVLYLLGGAYGIKYYGNKIRYIIEVPYEQN